MDKLKNKPLEEDLKYSDRCIITLKSYLEIILNYGIIYYGLSTRYAQNIFSSKEPLISPRLDNVFEGVYFSINTISILGYGDIQPNHFSSQFFSSLEVLSGVFLFIVSFATYLTLNFTPVSNLKTKKKIKSAKIDKQLLLLQISIIFFIIIREVIEISRWL
ncbi:potassium channel family protein [Halonatronum saccharophilum]|uniref:potassium channel family protein n=1 Tax=Halonatronum saccharophilum TaxID=150060 RepID=UPI001B7F7FE1|nr:potassium channel family protein [Halonatronum saccharophilum]